MAHPLVMKTWLTFVRHGLNFIKLDGDIGCLGACAVDLYRRMH